MQLRVKPRAGLMPPLIVAAVLVVLTWCLVSNHEIACVVVALAMPVLVPILIRDTTRRTDWTMLCMVGGTAGGLLGGIVVRIFCAPDTMMPMMMASMAGMVGGTLCGWGIES